MKRLLVVAQDRALTRFVAEALLARPLDSAAPRVTDPWEIARAHSALECFLLITKGGRPFDVILIDQSLPDEPILSLLSRIRKEEMAAHVHIFLLTERGRDPHTRRSATEQFSVTGFIEKPVTEETLRSSLDSLERRRRILLIESNVEVGMRYKDVLAKAGYSIELALRGQDGLDRAPRLRPDAVVVALALEDMRGAEVCVDLKRTRTHGNVPVVLYGQAGLLATQEIAENAHRADDFLQAPFDDGLLVERITSLIGKGITASGPRTPISLLSPPAIPPGPPTANVPPPKSPAGALRRIDSESGRSPPPSASPAAIGPTKRSTRRVPCRLSMSIRNGEKVYRSQTLDISHGGIFLATDEPLEIGELIDISFQLPESDRIVSAVGKVAWRGAQDGEHPSPGVGVKFSRIEPADLQLIVDYVNRVSKVVYSAS